MRPGCLLLALSICAATAVAEDDWIGLDQSPPLLLGFDIGEDEDQNSTRALMFSLPAGRRAGVYGYYGETELNDSEQSFDSLLLATTIWFELAQMVDIELKHFFEGNDDELEQETLGLALALDQGEWNFSVQLDQGDIRFFTRSVGEESLDRRLPSSVDSDVSAISVALGSEIDAWYWQASYRRYDYERDVSRFINSRLAELVVKSSALAQSSLLISQTASLLLGVADFDNDYSLLISQDRSVVDQGYDESLVLGWQRWGGASFGFQLAASMLLPVEDSLGLTLGLRWAL